jgi:hypothetical protein
VRGSLVVTGTSTADVHSGIRVHMVAMHASSDKRLASRGRVLRVASEQELQTLRKRSAVDQADLCRNNATNNSTSHLQRRTIVQWLNIISAIITFMRTKLMSQASVRRSVYALVQQIMPLWAPHHDALHCIPICGILNRGRYRQHSMIQQLVSCLPSETALSFGD